MIVYLQKDMLGKLRVELDTDRMYDMCYEYHDHQSGVRNESSQVMA